MYHVYMEARRIVILSCMMRLAVLTFRMPKVEPDTSMF